MNAADTSWTFDEQIPSAHTRGCEIIQLVLEQLNKTGWSDGDVFAVQMALEESIMNAIKHGNKNDLNKLVHVQIHLNDRDFQLKVTDQGSGFVLDDVPDPTLDENIEKCSGRGIMLMKQLMDSVIYNEKGNSVELVKHRDVSR